MRCFIFSLSLSYCRRLLISVGDLPGIKAGPEWIASAVDCVRLNMAEYSGSQMCDIVVALGRYGYRPPADVFDAFVQVGE